MPSFRKFLAVSATVLGLAVMQGPPAVAQSAPTLTQFNLCVTVFGDPATEITAQILPVALADGSIILLEVQPPEACAPQVQTTSWIDYLTHELDFTTKLDAAQAKFDKVRHTRGISLRSLRRSMVNIRNVVQDEADWLSSQVPDDCWVPVRDEEEKVNSLLLSFANKGIRSINNLNPSLARSSGKDYVKAISEESLWLDAMQLVDDSGACISPDLTQPS